MLNPLEAIARIVKGQGRIFLVDSMSAFGGVPLDIAVLGIDFIVSRRTNAFKACRASGLSSREKPSWPNAKGGPDLFRLIFTTNGPAWKKVMANGALLRRPMSCGPLRKR